MHAMVEAGVDVIELGVPFSDPVADGPVIQLASERALEHKMSLRRVLAIAAEFRKTNQHTPVVLMGYVNPIEAMGYEDFANAAQRADIDGVLTVDLPPEEAKSASLYCRHGILTQFSSWRLIAAMSALKKWILPVAVIFIMFRSRA